MGVSAGVARGRVRHLRHGALVAREYGKPHVVGIHSLLDRLPDGALVEVDGTAGVVRLVHPGASEAGAE
jgi:phosphohistidine swiveling domain-containing protein